MRREAGRAGDGGVRVSLVVQGDGTRPAELVGRPLSSARFSEGWLEAETARLWEDLSCDVCFSPVGDAGFDFDAARPDAEA